MQRVGQSVIKDWWIELRLSRWWKIEHGLQKLQIQLKSAWFYDLMGNEREMRKARRFWPFLQIVEVYRQPWLTVYHANYIIISAEARIALPQLKNPVKDYPLGQVV